MTGNKSNINNNTGIKMLSQWEPIVYHSEIHNKIIIRGNKKKPTPRGYSTYTLFTYISYLTNKNEKNKYPNSPY